MRILFAFICCFIFVRSFSLAADSTAIDAGRIKYFDSVEKKCFLVAMPRNTIRDRDIPFLPYPGTAFESRSVPDSMMEMDCFVKFVLENSSDSVRQMYFIPGYHLRTLKLFAASPQNISGTFHALPPDTLNQDLFKYCGLVTIQPHETLVCYARFNFLRTNINSYIPRVIDVDFLWSWVMMVKNRDSSMHVITYVASGILLLMIFYSFAVFRQNRRREFLYYGIYALCTVALLFLKSFLSFKPSAFYTVYEEYLDFMILCGGVFFYLGFIKKFLDTGHRALFLEKMIRYTGITLTLLLIAFSYIYLFTDKYIILNTLENGVIKLLIFALGIIVIIYGLLKKDPLLNYLAAGNIALVFFSMISLGVLVFKWKFNPGNPLSVFNRSMLYYETGLVAEMALFLFGLAYKNKKDITEQVKEREKFKRESERKEFEKQMAMMAVRQEERDRISADMHDDLGSGVTAIRLMSEIVKSKMNTEKFPEIDKISNSANELLGKMNAIIWTMKSSNDTVGSLAAYLRAYATEYFDATPVTCRVEVNELADREMSGEKRRNIFLCFKETLNNILKHAQATEVKIMIGMNDGRLNISIQDNGRGIDLENIRKFGNGLNNIRKRMQSIQGQFVIGNSQGTLVCFEIDLNGERPADREEGNAGPA